MAGIEDIEIAAHTACTRNDKIAGMTWGEKGTVLFIFDYSEGES